MVEDGSLFHKHTPMSQLHGKLLSEPEDCRISSPVILFCEHNKSGYSPHPRVAPVRVDACSVLFFCDVMEDGGDGCLHGLLSVRRGLSSGGKSHGSPLPSPVGLGGWGRRGVPHLSLIISCSNPTNTRINIPG